MLFPAIGLLISRMHAQIDCLPFCNSVFLQQQATPSHYPPLARRHRSHPLKDVDACLCSITPESEKDGVGKLGVCHKREGSLV